MQVVDRGQTKWQIGQNDNLFDWTYVVNVAHAHLLAADKLGSTYPLSDFRLPLDAVNLSVGQHTIPTSYARPLGPNVEPSAEEREIADRFARGEKHESDVRPVLRTKMDQFAAEAALDPDTGVGPTVAGQAFFITNCEPYYFWDHAHTMWKLAGHVPPYLIRLPEAVGLLLGTLAEAWAKLSGKEAGFTRFRVTFATQKRFYDVERARRLLGYTPIVGVEEGLKKTVEVRCCH
jgi:sterol-4alpha-carboxylate 3-dehydrogenase (decarboxylating)